MVDFFLLSSVRIMLMIRGRNGSSAVVIGANHIGPDKPGVTSQEGNGLAVSWLHALFPSH